MRDDLRIRSLQRAVDLLGLRRAAAALDVSRIRVDLWLKGSEPLPDRIFLRIVDILFEHGLAQLQKRPDGKPNKDSDSGAQA